MNVRSTLAAVLVAMVGVVVTPGAGLAVDDTTPPSVELLADAGPFNGAFTVTAQFSETVTGLDLSDFTKTNASLGSFTAVDGDTYTLVVTPTSDGAVTVDLAAGKAQDAAGNGNTVAAQLSRTYDATPPDVELSAVGSGPYKAAYTVTAQFTETVTGMTQSDLVVSSNATLSDFEAVDGDTYRVLVTPTADGEVTVDLAAGKAQDAAGNGNTVADQLSRTYDTTRPTVELSAAAGPRKAPFTVTAQFSETVTGVGLGDFTKTNATLSDFEAVDGDTYQVLVTPTLEGTVTVDLAADRAEDLAGNGNTAAGQLSRTYDTTRPTVTLSAPTGPRKAPYTVTVQFSETVTGMTLSDLVVSSNATLGSFSAVDGDTYEVLVTPTADGVVTVDLAADRVEDLAGNGNTAAGQLSRTYDTTRPTVTLGADPGPFNAAYTVTVQFSETVTGMTQSDLVVSSNATLGSFAAVDGDTYTVVVTPTAEGTVTVDLAADRVEDLAGNGNTAAGQLSRTYDVTPPTVTLGADPGPFNAPFTVTAQFSETVTGMTQSDLVVSSNATLGSFSAVDGDTYTVVVTPTADGTVTIGLAAAKAADLAGNGNTAATTISRTYDATPPTVTLSAAAGPRKAPYTVTVQFSETVTGMTLSDLVVSSNATLGSFSAVDGDTYEVLVTPTADGVVTVDLAAGKAQDLAGNGNTVADQLSRTYDATPPTVELDADPGPFNAPYTVTAQFSETVTGMTLSDLVVSSNATLGSFAAVDGDTYTVLVTPTAEGAVTVDLAAGKAQDLAGNGNTVADRLSRTYDVTPPTVQLTADPGPFNAPYTVTAQFSEAVTGMTQSDLSVTNGTLGSFAAVDGDTYTVVVTPTADGTVTVGLAAGRADDLAGNPSEAATSLQRVYDHTRPQVSLAAPPGPFTGPFTVTATFTEPVTGLTESDFTFVNGAVTAGTLSSMAGSTTTYTVQVTPAADGPVTVRLPRESARDAAGNLSYAAGPLHRDYDGSRPSVTLSAPTGLRKAPFDVTVQFSEPVTGFDVSDLDVTNATLGDLAGTDRTYTVLVTPTSDGVVTIGMAADKVADAAGNTSTAATTISRTYDGTPPIATLGAPTGPVRAPFTVTVDFAEPVTGLELTDVVVTNGTPSLLSGSAAAYTVRITPTADGVVTIGLPAGAVTDLAGNGNPSATLSRTYDTARPTVTLSAPAGPILGPFHLDVTFSEPVSGLALSDFTVSSGTVTELTGSGAAYTVLVTPAADGSVTIGLPAAAATDAAGNTSTAATPLTRDYDASAPTVTLGAGAGPVNGPVVVTITFSEPVTGLELGDFDLTGPVTLEDLDGSGADYTMTMRPTGDGTIGATLVAGTVTDDAGNGNTASAALSLVADLTAPVATLTGPTVPQSGSFAVTVAFSETVSGLTAGDLTVTNGSVTSVTDTGLPAPGRTWTVVVDPAAEGNVLVRLVAGAVTDTAGNANVATGPVTVVNDETGPSVQLTAPAGILTGPFQVTATFSEPVTGLAVGDFVVGNGSASALAGSGTVFTVTVTPGSDGLVTVDLPADAAEDAAGNASALATTLQRTVDTITPTVTLSAAASGVPAAGVVVRLTFSEDVTGLTASDLVVTGGAVSGDVTAVDSRRYDVRVVPSANGSVSVRLPAGTVRDLADNPNLASDTLPLTADVTAPTVTLAAPTGPLSGAFSVTVTFSEAVTGLTADDFELGNATAGTLAGSGALYILGVVPAGDGTVTVRLPAGRVVDGVGNPNAAAGPASLVNDQTAPVLALARASGQAEPAHGATIRFTVTADEAVTSLDQASLQVSGAGAAVASVSRVDDRTFGVTVTGMQSDGTVVLRAVAGAVRDAVGNASAAASSAGVEWSAAETPELTVTPLDQSCLTRGGTIGLGLSSDATVTATTSKAALVPESGIGLRRTKDGVEVTIRPRAGRSGVARVVVTARNDAGTSRQTVTVRVGTNGRDRLAGGKGTDLLVGLGGDDVLSGGAGDDLLCGGAGDDRLLGGAGDDVLDGQQGTNVTRGGAGKNKVVRTKS